jgi:GNAT superfamily N-acetyltransferase
MMNPVDLLELYDREERQNATFYNSLREEMPHVVRFRPKPGMKGGCWILYSHLTSENADQVIEEQVADFERLGLEFEWKLYDHDQPPDLRDRLAAHGFAVGETEALMVLDLTQISEALLRPVTHDIRRIADPEQIYTAAIAVQEEIWQENLAWQAEELAQELRLDGEHISFYAGYADERPICSAWIRFSERGPSARGSFASLWGGSTLPAYRKHGFYTALVATRAQEAIRRGYRFLTIDASPMSRPIVARHGFQLLTYTYPCRWHPSSTSSHPSS